MLDPLLYGPPPLEQLRIRFNTEPDPYKYASQLKSIKTMNLGTSRIGVSTDTAIGIENYAESI